MNKKCLLFGWMILIGLSMFAQTDPVLMRINGQDILRSEFAYSFQNQIGNNKLSPKEYAQQFILTKLKANLARTFHLDTVAKFKDEMFDYQMRYRMSSLIDNNGQVVDNNIQTSQSPARNADNNERIQIIQIFRRLPQNVTSNQLEKERSRMDSIYGSISNRPTDFEKLVNTYSDDKKCRWIKRLETISGFEAIAFSLPKGGISKPFLTPEGIHIIMVLDKDISSDLLKAANRQKYGMPNQQVLVEMNKKVNQLKNKYSYSENAIAFDEIAQKGTTNLTLFSIEGKEFTPTMFKRFCESHPQSIQQQLNNYIIKSLLDYEIHSTDMSQLSDRYFLSSQSDRLLADMMTGLKVTQPSTTDKAGLTAYFKSNSSDYKWDQPRFRGIIIHSKDKKTGKRAKKLLKQIPENEWNDFLQFTFNKGGEEILKTEYGIFVKGENEYVDKFIFKSRNAATIMSHPFTIVEGKKRRGPDSYVEVIDRVQKDYKTYLNTLWERDLLSSSKIEINQEVLKTVNNS